MRVILCVMLCAATLMTMSYAADTDIISCYFEKDRPKVADLDPSLCTHIILIGSCTLDDNCHIVLPPVGFIDEIKTLKTQNSKLKVLFSLTPDNKCMSEVVLNTNLTNQLVSNVTEYIVKNSVDGFDIDWEFPVWSSDAKSTDKKGFAALVEAIRKSFDRTSEKLLLTVAVAAPYTMVKKAYDVDAFNRFVDFCSNNEYDFHVYTMLQPFVAFNAPLFRKLIEVGTVGKLNSDYSTRYWLDYGLLRNKTVFGIPTYGRGYTLVDRYMHFVYAPASGVSKFGETYTFTTVCNLTDSPNYTYVFDHGARSPYIHGGDKQWLGFEDMTSMFVKATYAKRSNLAGIMIFDLASDDFSVCNLTDSPNYTYVFDHGARSPYIHGGDKQWLGFEDMTSMFVKATYAKRSNLAGIMIFDLASDDFSGLCGKGKYPLIRAAKTAIRQTDHIIYTIASPTENFTKSEFNNINEIVP
ncbi:Chitotriosidase-1 [Toxocara canis]|uniref:Chitotriosidase-1 n=1 Tax=Toxocara canis TaxID=6265 RepID=A0A0B2UV50_TOXCA|nr:Chitotriosidase-1 [Toxocara canis]